MAKIKINSILIFLLFSYTTAKFMHRKLYRIYYDECIIDDIFLFWF